MSDLFDFDFGRRAVFELGEPVQVTLSANDPAYLETATALRLSLRRVVYSGDFSVLTRDLHLAELDQPSLRSNSWSFTFSVPGDAPCTFSGRMLRVEWGLFAELAIPRRPDLKQFFRFEIVPRGFREARRAITGI